MASLPTDYSPRHIVSPSSLYQSLSHANKQQNSFLLLHPSIFPQLQVHLCGTLGLNAQDDLARGSGGEKGIIPR